MSIFKKAEAAQELIAVIGREQQEVATLERQLAGLEPMWNKAEEQVERLILTEFALARGYRQPAPIAIPGAQAVTLVPGTGTSQGFFDKRSAAIKEQLEAAIRERDSLTSEIEPKLAAIKRRVFQRLGYISGAFTNWCGVVCGKEKYVQLLGKPKQFLLPDAVRSDLLAARTQAASFTDAAELFKFIERAVERIEELDDINGLPIFRLDEAVKKGLEVQ